MTRITEFTERDAALEVKPYAVDISSGIETHKVKDREKILAAVREVRNGLR